MPLSSVVRSATKGTELIQKHRLGINVPVNIMMPSQTVKGYLQGIATVKTFIPILDNLVERLQT
jgi:hypothetical protein